VAAGQISSRSLKIYGDSLIFKLPNSGLDVSNCTKYFKISLGGTQLLEPDLLGPLTEADDCSGRDAVLEAVLRQ
jgi:hypothetical protein